MISSCRHMVKARSLAEDSSSFQVLSRLYRVVTTARCFWVWVSSLVTSFSSQLTISSSACQVLKQQSLLGGSEGLGLGSGQHLRILESSYSRCSIYLNSFIIRRCL